MTSIRRHLIVGAGLAAARTAEALREAGSGERIVLVGDEVSAPYLRPPLSKDFLAGSTSRDAIDVLPETWYRDNERRARHRSPRPRHRHAGAHRGPRGRPRDRL